eukprot:gnl/TRDRNA2_/TRDRNA2_158382_c0_seq1.p1 gnl/TRDRNA2_/TRDRNA2_158382_c0~~gnl/TRDRNA2_/TRDRNA2_158382_c0_seq1.p1  ORF type:complete len:504 (-),score=120.41 gnl/TRDRNA2_/TRDRNA2_158382_c0_seq1:219-1670(-)
MVSTRPHSKAGNLSFMKRIFDNGVPSQTEAMVMLVFVTAFVCGRIMVRSTRTRLVADDPSKLPGKQVFNGDAESLTQLCEDKRSLFLPGERDDKALAAQADAAWTTVCRAVDDAIGTGQLAVMDQKHMRMFMQLLEQTPYNKAVTISNEKVTPNGFKKEDPHFGALARQWVLPLFDGLLVSIACFVSLVILQNICNKNDKGSKAAKKIAARKGKTKASGKRGVDRDSDAGFRERRAAAETSKNEDGKAVIRRDVKSESDPESEAPDSEEEDDPAVLRAVMRARAYQEEKARKSSGKKGVNSVEDEGAAAEFTSEGHSSDRTKKAKAATRAAAKGASRLAVKSTSQQAKAQKKQQVESDSDLDEPDDDNPQSSRSTVLMILVGVCIGVVFSGVGRFSDFAKKEAEGAPGGDGRTIMRAPANPRPMRRYVPPQDVDDDDDDSEFEMWSEDDEEEEEGEEAEAKDRLHKLTDDLGRFVDKLEELPR